MIRMLTKRGLRASDLVCSPDVADTIINDAAVQKLLDNRRIEIGNVEPELLPDGAAIVARLNVLGRIISVISYDLTYTDDEGKDKLYIPSGKCVLTAPGAGRTAYGRRLSGRAERRRVPHLRRPPRAEVCEQRRRQQPHADHLQPPADDPQQQEPVHRCGRPDGLSAAERSRA